MRPAARLPRCCRQPAAHPEACGRPRREPPACACRGRPLRLPTPTPAARPRKPPPSRPARSRRWCARWRARTIIDLSQGQGHRRRRPHHEAGSGGLHRSSSRPRAGSLRAVQRRHRPHAAPVEAATSRAARSGSLPRRRLRAAGQAKTRIEPMSTMRIRIAEHMVCQQAHLGARHHRASRRYDQGGAHARPPQRRFPGELRHVADLPAVRRARHGGGAAHFPLLNASIDGTNIIYHNEINIGIAVALENGLIVPVIRKADEKNVLGLQRSIVDLATRARSRQLKPDEVQGGTFSITNFGSFGSVFATPVINQPQVAILGVGTVEKMPVVIDDAIAIRSIMLSVADLRPSPDRRRAGRSVHGQGEVGAGELVGRSAVTRRSTGLFVLISLHREALSWDPLAPPGSLESRPPVCRQESSARSQRRVPPGRARTPGTRDSSGPWSAQRLPPVRPQAPR